MHHITRIVLAIVLAASATPAVQAANVHAPLGYQIMCLKAPAECKGGGPTTIRATASQMAVLNKVNLRVNRNIRPVADGSVDVWTVDAKSGDCEEFALAKRDALIREGLPPSALRLAYVKTRSGEGHAVLIVKTGGVDLVLDVLTPKIKPLSQSGLRLMSMAGANPNKWI